jgi:tRNA dimethylallyltransferase
VPIIVGGSNYYVEALLFQTPAADTVPAPAPVAEATAPDTDDAYAQLQQCGVSRGGRRDRPLKRCHGRLDPQRAAQLHPRDQRKVLRALARVRGAHPAAAAAAVAPPRAAPRVLRFPRTLILWVDASSQAVLDTRLDARAGRMAEQGLLEEVASFAAELRELSPPSLRTADGRWDFSRGLLQAIGCKELLDAATLHPLPLEPAAALATVKAQTRRYARQQLAWLRNRFVRGAVPLPCPLHRFVCDDPARFHEDVVAPALSVLDAFLAGSPLPAASAVTTGLDPKNTDWERHTCERCGGRLFLGSVQWQAHLRSRSHRNAKPRPLSSNAGTQGNPD